MSSLVSQYVDVSPGRIWKSQQVLGHLTPPGGGRVVGNGKTVPFHLQEEKAAAAVLSELDPAGSGPPTGPDREPKEERGGQAESTASGEL